MCAGIVSQHHRGGQFCFDMPTTGCCTNLVFATTNSQSSMQQWSFLLLLTCCCLLEEELVVCSYKLSKSDTNVDLGMGLPLLGCSNSKNDYLILNWEIFDLGIVVDCDCDHNHPSSGLQSHHYCHYPPRIDSTVRHFHFSRSHSFLRWSFDYCGHFCCRSGTCHWCFDHCGTSAKNISVRAEWLQ